MHPDIYAEYEKILDARKDRIGKRVLEVGAVPGSDSLLNLPAFSGGKELIGINLDAGDSYDLSEDESINEFRIIRANANNMDCFKTDYFDTVVCNALLEHDMYFWKTIAEIKRVAKPGALVVIGAPGFDDLENIRLSDEKDRFRRRVIDDNQRLFRGTPVIKVHCWPGDYYRFSPQAFKDVVFENMSDVEVYSMLIPPRIIGIGYNNQA